MENTSTVRIDLQRLQILNDRLCQTLEALNQIRLSAHSPAYFGGAPVGYGIPAYGMPTTAMNPYMGQYVNPYIGATPYAGVTPYVGATPFYGYGIPAVTPNFFGGVGVGHAVGTSPIGGINTGWGVNTGRVAPVSFQQPTVW
jgi:hypothetical protein